MRIPWHAIWTLGLAGGLLLPAGCRSPGPDGLSAGRLRIGVVADSPPLVFRQSKRWAGVEADLGRAFAARLGLKPVFQAFPAEQLAAALLDGHVDVLMAGLPVTDDRRVRMDFANPYLVVGQAALVRTGDLARCTTPIKITSAQARVGVVADTAGDRLVSGYFTRADRVAFPDAETAVEALLRDQIALFIHDAPAVWWLALRYESQLAVAPPLFAKEEIAWAFRRGSVTLRESANQALADWQQDGTLEAILKRWMPVAK